MDGYGVMRVKHIEGISYRKQIACERYSGKGAKLIFLPWTV